MTTFYEMMSSDLGWMKIKDEHEKNCEIRRFLIRKIFK